MIKIVTILGARPQFIKAAMVSQEILKSRGLQEVIIHTGQHFDVNMSKVFFEDLKIPVPKYNLNINGGSHSEMTGAMLIEIEKILIKERPNLVLVYGDTNSTLAGALAARKLNLKLCHVEGGLRNFDFSIPEDVNRVLTDRISNIIICSTPIAIENLKKEGFDNFPCEIHLSGDLMADAFLYHSKIAKKPTYIPKNKFILCTVHRASNTTHKNLEIILKALNEISKDYEVIFPAHPRTKKILESANIKISPRIRMVAPVGYHEMMGLLLGCTYVVTDSGGLQREAYLANKKALLLMEYTPWEELVEHGYSVLSQITFDDILSGFEKTKNITPSGVSDLYGNGRSAYSIVEILKKSLKDS